MINGAYSHMSHVTCFVSIYDIFPAKSFMYLNYDCEYRY